VTDDARAVTAVVLGGGPTGLAVLRELSRAGVPVLATADGDDLVTASRYFRPLPARVAAQDQDGIEASFRSLELERAVRLLAGLATSGVVAEPAPDLLLIGYPILEPRRFLDSRAVSSGLRSERVAYFCGCGSLQARGGTCQQPRT
jgi:hypothetical protein